LILPKSPKRRGLLRGGLVESLKNPRKKYREFTFGIKCQNLPTTKKGGDLGGLGGGKSTKLSGFVDGVQAVRFEGERSGKDQARAKGKPRWSRSRGKERRPRKRKWQI